MGYTTPVPVGQSLFRYFPFSLSLSLSLFYSLLLPLSHCFCCPPSHWVQISCPKQQTEQDMASGRKMGYKFRIAGVFLLLLASIAALVAVAIIQDTWAFNEYTIEYGIVIDSGSSRSNVYLYEWPGEGISAMKVDPDTKKDVKSLEAFQVCMDKVLKIIPSAKHNTTTLFLGATAGMRLLHEQNEARSNEIMESIRTYLSSLPFNFQNASIITGQEEGLYGWVTANYLKGNLLEKNLWNTYVHPDGRKTTGSMDLGGASTQIAFAVPEDLRGPDYMNVKMYGYSYNVYTHSFLCYGKNELGKKVLEKIVEDSNNFTYIENPCYPEGFNITIEVSEIFDSKCTNPKRLYSPDQTFFMVGGSNSDKCKEIVKSVFDFNTCSHKQCSFNGVEQPPVTGEFMAYAGFFYTARALLLNGTSYLEQFNATIGNFCHTHWTVVSLQVNKLLSNVL
ncbi:ectonucleoside triphosphate diphosphohydrolase 3 isoform X3 [Cynoglossus semilaevis]|uniref:ectonucleoside triphosphate diphosphohydrolase 3 isoform X3 n=1 Tax=Cynoglossus semilaevis TaxID=244447 RepID=UPI000D625E13|nr:ectonucleoside triphosphate diphosphohydrolase 3 isoform X3 [Cynoglossus semilaevis]